MNTAKQDFQRLMSMTESSDDIMAIAFAGVISMRIARPPPYDAPIAGLDSPSMDALMQLFFRQEKLSPSPERASCLGNGDEFGDLLDLLLEHRTIPDEKSRWLAHAVATACMADNHLWQDMGLPGRTVLSQLLNTFFTSLAQRNTGDMKWKKFFYRQICERSGLMVCRAPSCKVCSDYSNCFGSEEPVTEHHATAAWTPA